MVYERIHFKKVGVKPHQAAKTRCGSQLTRLQWRAADFALMMIKCNMIVAACVCAVRRWLPRLHRAARRAAAVAPTQDNFKGNFPTERDFREAINK